MENTTATAVAYSAEWTDNNDDEAAVNVVASNDGDALRLIVQEIRESVNFGMDMPPVGVLTTAEITATVFRWDDNQPVFQSRIFVTQIHVSLEPPSPECGSSVGHTWERISRADPWYEIIVRHRCSSCGYVRQVVSNIAGAGSSVTYFPPESQDPNGGTPAAAESCA